jgi:hypothetical protein
MPMPEREGRIVAARQDAHVEHLTTFASIHNPDNIKIHAGFIINMTVIFYDINVKHL